MSPTHLSAHKIAAGVVAVSYGKSPEKMARRTFPPVVTGTIVMTVGISIFNLAIGNIAGGTSSETFGDLKNWAVGIFVVAVVLGFNVFGKGLPKVAAILIGMVAGYLVSIPLVSLPFPASQMLPGSPFRSHSHSD